MSDYPHTVVSDALGGQVVFPPFITQGVLDNLKHEFISTQRDVFVVTFPRSGTTWTEHILQLLVRNGAETEERLTDVVPWLETLPDRPGGLKAFLAWQAEIKADGENELRLFTSHLPYPMFQGVSGNLGRCVYVARNPKDVAVSYYFHDCSKHNYEGSWPEHLNLFMRGEVHFGSYFDHVLPWWQASCDRPEILFLKYETMIQNHPGVVRQIADFLGLSVDSHLIDRVVEKSRFRAMAQNTKTNFSWVPQRRGKPGHYRKGIIGDWRNHFDEEQNRAFDAFYEEKMTETGLQFDFGEGVVLPKK